jgi:hypothetical protein
MDDRDKTSESDRHTRETIESASIGTAPSTSPQRNGAADARLTLGVLKQVELSG